MNYKKILLATDFSPVSTAALEYATALASHWNALLLIVHVEEPLLAAGADPYFSHPYFPNPEIRRMLEAVKPACGDVRYEHRLVLGVAPDEIPRVAEEEHVDLIVMGTHGRSGLSRVVMGSVAELVVRRAKCPVLTLKPESSAKPSESVSCATAAQ